MEKQKYDEMRTTIKELKDFAVVAAKLAGKLESIFSNTVRWQNELENAQLLAQQERASVESIKAETLIALNRLPHELAPLRNKIAEQDRQANTLMTEAMRKNKEAQERLDKASALLSHAEQTTASEVPAVSSEKRGPGRPKKEAVA